MKKNLLVSFLFFLFVTGTYAQHFESLSECKSIEDTLRYLQHTFLEPKDKFVGKPAKEVIEAFRKVLPIKSAVLHRSSPWIDKEGLSYRWIRSFLCRSIWYSNKRKTNLF